MIDPVYKRLLAENAWLKQQIALLQESNSLHDDVDKMSLAEKKKYYNAIRREKVSDQEDAVERKERLALIKHTRNSIKNHQDSRLQEEHESDKKKERHNAYLEILKKDTPEDIALHNQIVDKVARHHGKMYPHMTTHISGGGAPDTEKSIEDIKDTLAAPGIWQRPLFKSVDHALNCMKDDGSFAPYHLTQPNGYMGDDDDRYSEMLKGVKDSIDTEEEKKK